MEQAVERLGPGPLTEPALQTHIRPLFSRALAGGGNYFVTHALGRPLDRTAFDVAKGVEAWTARLRGAWEPWLAEEEQYRAQVAQLLGLPAPSLVVPKLHAEAALRAVLNTLPQGATVLTTEDEFAAVAVVLAQYAAVGRLRVVRAASDGGRWHAGCFDAALRNNPQTSLVVVSQCFYKDGQLFGGLPELAQICRAQGARLLVDGYHSVGAVPVDMPALGCDYLLGGCYKYLRGGPGIGFLAFAPWIPDQVRPLDIGWFAQDMTLTVEAEPTGYRQIDPWQPGGPTLRPGGDGWLEGSPAVLTYYQARAGLAFTLAMGMDRLRAYSLGQLGFLKQALAAHGIESCGADERHGQFLVVPHPRAPELVAALARENIIVDERAGNVRLCPDLLTTREELEQAAQALVRLSKTR